MTSAPVTTAELRVREDAIERELKRLKGGDHREVRDLTLVGSDGVVVRVGVVQLVALLRGNLADIKGELLSRGEAVAP